MLYFHISTGPHRHNNLKIRNGYRFIIDGIPSHGKVHLARSSEEPFADKRN